MRDRALLTINKDHEVIANYSRLYEECDVEHINVLGTLHKVSTQKDTVQWTKEFINMSLYNTWL